MKKIFAFVNRPLPGWLTVALLLTGLAGAAVPIYYGSLSVPATGSLTTNASSTVSLGAPLSVANGGTGSATQNFVDLSTAQAVNGVKTFGSAPVSANGFTAGSSTYGPTSATVNGHVAASGGVSIASNINTGPYIAIGDLGVAQPNAFIMGNSVTGTSYTSINSSANLSQAGVTSNVLGVYSQTQLLALDSSGNLGIYGSYHSGSSTYGPTGASVNGAVEVTDSATTTLGNVAPCYTAAGAACGASFHTVLTTTTCITNSVGACTGTLVLTAPATFTSGTTYACSGSTAAGTGSNFALSVWGQLANAFSYYFSGGPVSTSVALNFTCSGT